MSSRALDIVAIGDAIVDVIATSDDSFLEKRAACQGVDALLTADEADALYGAMGPAREISGGSAANSMAGAAALGLERGVHRAGRRRPARRDLRARHALARRAVRNACHRGAAADGPCA